MKRPDLKSNRKRFFLIFLFSIMTACTEKESIDLCAAESYGEFKLLESSRTSIPYTQSMDLFFLDSLGDQIVLEVGADGYGPINFINSAVCEHDKTKEKIIAATGDGYFFLIMEPANSLNMIFRLHLSVVPYEPNSMSMLADVLHLYVGENSNVVSSSKGSLSILVNQRELIGERINNYFSKPIDQLTLQNKTFSDVYTNKDLQCYYNYEMGLIAFRDNDGKLWVLDRMEKKGNS